MHHFQRKNSIFFWGGPAPSPDPPPWGRRYSLPRRYPLAPFGRSICLPRPFSSP